MTRQEREDMAGERPPERPGYRLYARLNRNRFGEAYIWVYRQVRVWRGPLDQTQCVEP